MLINSNREIFSDAIEYIVFLMIHGTNIYIIFTKKNIYVKKIQQLLVIDCFLINV